MQGGMYNILEIIINIKFDENLFTCNELFDKLELSRPALTNNLHRLVAIGFLEKIESRDDKGYRKVQYKITEEAIEFIHNFIHR